MSILIKGMEMPKNCDDCMLGSDCPHDQSMDGYKMQGGRPRTCPLIPVPPHGRLIEADEFYDALCMDDRTSIVEAMHVQSILQEAPTIIPAERSET